MPIRILPPFLANRIAAGEVVERPSSVVKELLENSLDAGAGRIKVAVIGGGINQIEVTDNGGGIPKGELALALKRHATSKLSTTNPDKCNLSELATLGFRGEALAAIASVSEVELISTHRGKAWRLGDGETEPSPTAVIGTRLTVRGLFRRFPARLKFMKTAAAEYAAIHEVFVKLALACPKVEMSLEADNHKPLRFTVGDDAAAERLKRAAELLGKEFPANALPLLARGDDWSVSGWLGLPTYHRRNGILSFVNGRSVRDRVIIASLKDAYGDTVTVGKMPAATLFLECPLNLVDVNVHPSKTEVRFKNSRSLYGFIVKAVRDALTAAPLQTSSEKFSRFGGKSGGKFAQPSQSQPPRNQPENQYGKNGDNQYGDSARSKPFAASPLSLRSRGAAYIPSPLTSAAAAQSADVSGVSGIVSGAKESAVRGKFRILGQVDAKYILAEDTQRGGLAIIDQHAAHERIIYERLKKGLAESPPPRQVLLTPSVVNLSPTERQRLLKNAAQLEKLGLVIESFGGDAVAVREVPSLIKDADLDKLLNEIAVSYGEKRAYFKHLEKVCSLMACHGAIRGHRQMNEEEMLRLLELMEKTTDASQCNHGRPTIITLNIGDLDKLFERS